MVGALGRILLRERRERRGVLAHGYSICRRHHNRRDYLPGIHGVAARHVESAAYLESGRGRALVLVASVRQSDGATAQTGGPHLVSNGAQLCAVGGSVRMSSLAGLPPVSL